MGDREDHVIHNYLEWSDEGRPAIWRYLAAIVLGFLFWMWGSIPAILLLQDFLNDPATKSVAFEYTFVVGLVAIPLIVRYLLKRPAFSVALPSWPPRLADYGLGIAIQWAAMVVMYLVAAKVSFRGWEHVTAAAVPMLFAALLGLALQTAFEELYFRGLIAQATRRLIKWLPAVIGVQAVYFASLHVGNVEAWGGGNLAMVPYLVPALAWGWIAWRTGSLLMPMGLHFANNAFLVLFVNTRGDVLQTATPFIAETPTIERAALFAVGQAVLTIVAVEWIVRRRAARAAQH